MRDERRLRKADYEALAGFRQALRAFTAFSATAARKAGLTPQQHQVLLVIKGAPGRETATIGEIAASLMIRPHSAAELVDRLAQLGMAERTTDPQDHRRVLVTLTAQAEDILDGLSAEHLRELGAIRPTLLALLSRFEEVA
jgi:DNA-binding MarR family transcriptional regulator